MVFDFGVLPPEINSARVYCGPGSGPMLAAAEAWDGLAAEAYSAASGYSSVLSELTSSLWAGPASVSMVAAAAPYVSWLSATAAQAQESGVQARAAAAAYEAAFAMTVPPPVIAANRALLMGLIATNFFGQNAPAIAATEAHYAQMWAQDAAAMYGYAGAAATASTLPSFTAPPQTANPAAVAVQAAVVAKAAADGSHTAGTHAMTALRVAVAQLFGAVAGSHSSPNYLVILTDMLGALVYDPAGELLTLMGLFNLLIQGTAPGADAASGAALGAFEAELAPIAVAAGRNSALLGGSGFPAALSDPNFARAGHAYKVGKLSVPASWGESARALSPTASAGQSGAGGPGGLLRGLPMANSGQRGNGFVHKYGFRYGVVARPPSAG